MNIKKKIIEILKNNTYYAAQLETFDSNGAVEKICDLFEGKEPFSNVEDKKFHEAWEERMCKESAMEYIEIQKKEIKVLISCIDIYKELLSKKGDFSNVDEAAEKMFPLVKVDIHWDGSSDIAYNEQQLKNREYFKDGAKWYAYQLNITGKEKEDQDELWEEIRWQFRHKSNTDFFKYLQKQFSISKK